MPTYTVQKNETLLDIARRELSTTDVSGIVQHPENRHLFERGRSESILHEGDELVLPDAVTRTTTGVGVATGASHCLIARGRTRPFSVRLLDPSAQPLRNADYELRPDVGSTISAQTDGQGWIHARLHHDARSITLAVAEREYKVRLGSLDPAHTLSGIQSRLRNLGYLTGPNETTLTKGVQRALRTFQARHGIVATGVGCSETIERLIAEHGE